MPCHLISGSCMQKSLSNESPELEMGERKCVTLTSFVSNWFWIESMNMLCQDTDTQRKNIICISQINKSNTLEKKELTKYVYELHIGWIVPL